MNQEQNPDVSIDVSTEYLDNHSIPEERRFAFAYTITINNNSEEAVRLLSRHWIITDGDNEVREVRGEGVIGEQPLIEPGKCFRYTSGAIMDTAVGTMEGSYEMISASGRPFIAPIALFSLADPASLH